MLTINLSATTTANMREEETIAGAEAPEVTIAEMSTGV